MPILYGNSNPNRSHRSSLRLPASKRISAPSSKRLTTIIEGANGADAAPPIPRRSSRRDSASHSQSNSVRNSRRWSGSTTSEATQRTAPPPYEWVPEPIAVNASGSEDAVVDERLEKLRRGEGEERKGRRGGWLRAVLIIGIVLLFVIALAVGLGVGLTRRKNKDDNDQSQDTGYSTPHKPPQKFPLGQYSIVTALRSIETTCTSNPATWRCFPYNIYTPDTGLDTASLASFNWIISNTSSTFATNITKSTTSDGVPANLTVSTTNDPFGITFSNKPLTYIFDDLNTTSQRYTFDFTMSRLIIPSRAITTDNTNAECFFNQTVFTANIYLTALRTFPAGDTTASAAFGGYEQWPYAVEITMSAVGGDDVPNCYSTADGRKGEQITTGLIPQPDSANCICEYRNY